MAKVLRDDCFMTDADRLTHDAALAILRRFIAPVTETEHLAVQDAVGRMLAEDITAPRDSPGHDNAAVDGYAFRSHDYDPDGGTELRLVGRASAGHPHTAPCPQGGAIRIFTGAVMPPDTDTVVMQEDVSLDTPEAPSEIFIPPGLKAGANRRRAGEDVRKGHRLATAGDRLRPQDLAYIAAAGFGQVPVHRRLSAAVISTGDEVLRPGAPFERGRVYDANQPMLTGLLRNAGADVHDLGVLPDDPEQVRTALKTAAEMHQLIITTGGASQGEEDHLSSALAALGRRHFWQIAVKPGRPMMLGQIGDTVVIGLPGNPVAVFVCFLLYGWPITLRLAGAHWPEPMRIRAPAAFEIARKKPGRREFWRGSLVQTDNGPTVEKFPRDGSGLISSLTHSNGLIEVAEDVTSIEHGQPVDFIPYASFGITTVG